MYSPVLLETAEWALLSIYQSKRVARIRIGRIPPAIREEWMATTVLEGTEVDARISEVTWSTGK